MYLITWTCIPHTAKLTHVFTIWRIDLYRHPCYVTVPIHQIKENDVTDAFSIKAVFIFCLKN